MDPSKSYRYMATDTQEANPNRISKDCYQTEIGSTVNEVKEYLSRRIQEFVKDNGMPDDDTYLFTKKHMDIDATMEGVRQIMKKNNWDQKAFDRRW